MGHFLWNCPVYSERRALFLEHLKNNLGNEFEHLKDCDIAGKSYFILGTELWGSRYEELLCLVKSYIIDIWELRKSKLYGRSVFRVRGPWPKRYGYHLSIIYIYIYNWRAEASLPCLLNYPKFRYIYLFTYLFIAERIYNPGSILMMCVRTCPSRLGMSR